MNEQQKILRVFKLIKLLADKPSRNVPQLAKLLGVSKDTIYRYVHLLEEIGYHIDKTSEQGAYYLWSDSESLQSVFALEETLLLNQLINTIHQEHPLRESLMKKVYLSSTLLPLAEELIDLGMAKTVSLLNDAIADRKQVRLIQYHSASKDTIEDRWVEPICFVKANSQLSAFDLKSNQIKNFKLKRIGGVEVLDIHATKSLETHPTDFFGFTAPEPIPVTLSLTTLAHNLLIEEFPEAKLFISANSSSNNYTFSYEVRSFVGIGRFILGLPDDIEVNSPKELKEYLNKRVRKF